MIATDAAENRRRASERGQIVTLVVLTMATMGVMAMLAITFGQALVRRQQAQLVVDAAALAGATEQAKGLNTIARINERQRDFLNALCLAQIKGVAFGYEDNDGTTWARTLRLIPGDDWAIENWRAYESDVFAKWNAAVTLINTTYAPLGKPRMAAEKIVEENFGSPDNLFKGETPESGLVIPWHELAYPEKSIKLVELRTPQKYRIGGARRYKPYSNHYTMTCPETIGPFPNPLCTVPKNLRRLAYIRENAWFNGRALFGDVPEYTLGHFYGVPKDRDVRFTYYLELPLAQPVFASAFLKEIPKIVVIATAKPYGGHLGDEFDERWGSTNLISFGYNQQEGKEISDSYRAKLVPVRLVDRLQLASLVGAADDDLERFITAFH